VLAFDQALAGLLAERADARRAADAATAALKALHDRHAYAAPRPPRVAPDPPGELERFAARFGLDPVDRWILAAAVAPLLDPDYGAFYGALGGVRWSPLPLDVLYGLAGWLGVDRVDLHGRLQPTRPLRRWSLVELVEAPGQPPVVTAPAVVAAWAMGREAGAAVRVGPPDVIDTLVTTTAVAGELRAAAAWLAAHWGAAPIVSIRGRPESGRHAIAAAIVAAARRGWIEPGAGPAPARDARWLDAAVVLGAGAPIDPTSIDAPCVAVLDPDAAAVATERPVLALVVEPTAYPERVRLWTRELGGGPRAADLDPALLARRYRFGPGMIRELCARSRELAVAGGESGAIADRHVRAAVAASRRERPGDLATVMSGDVARDRLALGPEPARDLDLAIAWIRRGAEAIARGGPLVADAADAGLVCLLCGPSGTGKTLAAQVLGAETGLDVLRVDVSRVMSKYIGETEKHLDAVFRDAEAAGAILLFDEADAVFARRSDVKSSHDRYANVETGFLLQRLEAHRGVVVLTTNLERNLDDAFLRRIQIRIELGPPDEAQRAAIWRMHLPPGTDLEVDAFARRFVLTGGEIRNATLAALVLADRDGRGLDAGHVAVAVWREQRKLGRMMDAEMFRPWRAAIDAYADPGPGRRR
jgi:hypothetical protein